VTSRLRPSIAVLVVLVTNQAAFAQSVDLQGQLSTWFVLNDDNPSTPTVGIRYLPSLMFERPLGGERAFDVEVSLNVYASAQAPDWQDVNGTSAGKAYRVWARFKTSRFEARVGLQKINFGSATLLRPLMWFDSVDPRDPLQITNGVYAVLLRYFFPSNATVWTWGLYGNHDRKGLETSPSSRGTPEFGGRFQFPAGPGELAVTTHHRRADLRETNPSSIAASYAASSLDSLARTPEHRYALDGKWDLGIGVWFEGVTTRERPADLGTLDQAALNVGADYTFALGNGLHVLGEYFILNRSLGVFGEDQTSRLSAVSVRYPLGLLDTLSGIVYADAAGSDWYRFVSWQRTYDRWQLYLMGFWNPRQSLIFPGGEVDSIGRSPMSGRGLQVMVVFNH
jgi:hypothetical protein